MHPLSQNHDTVLMVSYSEGHKEVTTCPNLAGSTSITSKVVVLWFYWVKGTRQIPQVEDQIELLVINNRIAR
uniref:Uncharacterized protein n=1 Tax=Aegilops tauschii subsp. strangulata TaxID=200361 RepID=A0A453QFY7_AEGTS